MGFIVRSVVVLQLERCAATVSLVLPGMEMEKDSSLSLGMTTN